MTFLKIVSRSLELRS